LLSCAPMKNRLAHSGAIRGTDSMTFNHRIALVTGAAGIGKAIAGVLAQSGVTVICVSKNEASCGRGRGAPGGGGKARALAVDVADGAAVAKAAGDLLAEFGNIDILVNNAGITRDGLLFRMSEEDWTWSWPRT